MLRRIPQPSPRDVGLRWSLRSYRATRSPPTSTQNPLNCGVRLTSTPSLCRNHPSHVFAARCFTTSTVPQSTLARTELKNALLHLHKTAGNHINISRLQLAIRGLDQNAGQETIRIAVYGVGTPRDVRQRTKELVRLLIADPLVEEEEWERALMAEGTDNKPILLKIGANEEELRVSSNRLVRELYISSPLLNSYNLEILVLESEDLRGREGGVQTLDDVLVPTVEIPTSNTGRYTPVTTPVHKAVVLGNGIWGATKLMELPQTDNVMTAVNMPAYTQVRRGTLPFQLVDIPQAKTALAVFRNSVNNAMEYEKEWFASGLPILVDFVKGEGPMASTYTVLKSPVVSLISDVVADANIKIERSENDLKIASNPSKVPLQTLDTLRTNLKEWARRAHTELRDTLETAFHGRRWRKLNWWKLFWRVDDVSMIANDMLAQRFLPEAEKEIVFLAGKIDQAGVAQNLTVAKSAQQTANWAYKAPEAEKRVIALGTVAPNAQYSDILPKVSPEDGALVLKGQPWPLDIPITRGYLAQTTIPALQALAQKLLLQTVTTSGFASAFSTLIYVSDSTTSIYEAGAVAALGIVWSMRRLQTRWERARDFWEEEVREEGRRAIRDVEGSVENVLKVPEVVPVAVRREYRDALNAVMRVEKALARVQEQQSQA